MRQGRELSNGKKIEQLAKHGAGKFLMFVDQLINIDSEIGQVSPKWPHANVRIAIEVSLAELNEPPERSEAIHRPSHCLSGKRVQDDVYAVALSEGHHLIGKGKGSRV